MAEYLRVAGAIRNRIISGGAKPGYRLPNYSELGREFNVGQATIQKAIECLSEDGFVRTQPRSGTFVAESLPHLTKTALVIPQNLRQTQFYLALSDAAALLEQQGETEFIRYYPSSESSSQGDAERLGGDAVRRRFGSVIFAAPPVEEMYAPLLQDQGLRRILIGTRGKLSISAVGPDIHSFRKMAINHLLSLGRRRIAHLCVDARHVDPGQLMDELSGLGAELHPHWVQWVANGEVFRPATNIVRLLMALSPEQRPDALVIHDDNLIDHAIGGLLLSGVKVPEQLAIVAHTNFPTPVASVLPVKRLGFDCCRILRDCLHRLDPAFALRSGQFENHVVAAEFEDTIGVSSPGQPHPRQMSEGDIKSTHRVARNKQNYSLTETIL